MYWYNKQRTLLGAIDWLLLCCITKKHSAAELIGYTVLDGNLSKRRTQSNAYHLIY